MRRRPFLLRLSAVAGILAAPFKPALAADDALVARLRRGGHIILMRHAATVPGIGDPAGFVLSECATQRNLSDAGRADAARIGAAFQRLAIPVGEVLSSRWCRCLDTARLAFGKAEPAPMLDSMFDDGETQRDAKLRQLATWLKTPRGGANTVLVTHDVNIRALAREAVRQGEMVVATARPDGKLGVVGSWRP
ncbi:MAG: histidine phosphatase family protein [Massilia sp.]|jgi:broad specificity phosphatase PhoE|nr:histidine phosphatase family protein [Massilia sp.]